MVARWNSFFPSSSLPQLRQQRGSRWADILDHVSVLPVEHPEVIAFHLTVTRILRQSEDTTAGCREPFCAVCAARAAEVFDGTDAQLAALYASNLAEVTAKMRGMQKRTRQPEAMPAVRPTGDLVERIA